MLFQTASPFWESAAHAAGELPQVLKSAPTTTSESALGDRWGTLYSLSWTHCPKPIPSIRTFHRRKPFLEEVGVHIPGVTISFFPLTGPRLAVCLKALINMGVRTAFVAFGPYSETEGQ